MRHQNGFEILADILDPTKVTELGVALEGERLVRSRAGARHLMQYPFVQQLAFDSRLIAIATAFLGGAAVPFRVTLFDKSPGHNWLIAWHQDTALPLRERRDRSGWGPWSVKDSITYAHAPGEALSRVVALRVHLDDSCLDNGPLRVLPGTHTLGVLTDDEVGQLARQVDAYDCLVPAGGIIAMRPLLVHASSKAQSTRRRRVLHIEYAESLDVGDDLQLAVV